MVMGIPIGKLQNLDARVTALENGGGGGVGAWTALSVDGTTTVFAVSKQPTDVLADNSFMIQNFGYTYSAGFITFNNPPQNMASWR